MNMAKSGVVFYGLLRKFGQENLILVKLSQANSMVLACLDGLHDESYVTSDCRFQEAVSGTVTQAQ